MKTLTTFLVAIMIPGWMLCQVTIDAMTLVYPGDTIFRNVDLNPEGVEITAAGPDQVWVWTLSDSLMQVASFDTNDRPGDYPFATIKMTEGGVESYYVINELNWGLQGFVAEDPVGLGLVVSSFYAPAFSEEYAPVAFEDTIVQVFAVYTGIPLSIIPDSILQLLPVIPDSLRLKVTSVVTDDIDAWGTLEINGTSSEVLRQKRENRFAIAVEAKVSILPWVDITSLLLDFVDSLPGGISLADTSLSYRFLAPGYALPVAVLALNDDSTVSSVMFQRDILSSRRDFVLKPSEIKLFPNPTSGDVNILLSDIDRRVDRIIINDLTGRLVQASQVDGDQELVQIRLDGVPAGMYFLTLIDGQGKLLGTGTVSLIEN